LIYCPGSINLKPIESKHWRFQKRFWNCDWCSEGHSKYLPVLRKVQILIVLFSTVAAKLGMPFHASIATAKAGVEGLVKSLGWTGFCSAHQCYSTYYYRNIPCSWYFKKRPHEENMIERHQWKAI
jgi:hypothetical protein